MKKIFIPLFAVFSFFVLNMTTSAQSLETIVNDNGITITPEQYEYLSIFYSKNQIMKLSQTEIDEIIAKNMMPVSTQVQYIRTDSYIGFDNKVKESYNTIISEEEYENPIMPLSACENSLATRCWETTYKKLEFCGYISPDDPTSLYFTVSNWWKILPSTRSFDVVATTFGNFNLTNANGSQYYITSDGQDHNIDYVFRGTNMVVGSNGVGLSQNLVDDTSIISMTNTLRVWGTITNTRNYFVNSTFQHAQSDVTLAQSQNYQFSTNGLGGVLSFNNGIGSKYDAMTGLSFSVNY